MMMYLLIDSSYPETNYVFPVEASSLLDLVETVQDYLEDRDSFDPETDILSFAPKKVESQRFDIKGTSEVYRVYLIRSGECFDTQCQVSKVL